MSLIRKSSRATLRVTAQDYSSCMDQKNAIIASLHSEREALASTQDRYDRVKEQLNRVRGKYEGQLRDHEIRVGNNQERMEMTVRGVQELRGQAQLLGEELKLRMAALREAKFGAQQMADLANRREDEAAEAHYRLQEQQNLAEVRNVQQERTRLQIAQVREEVEKGRREMGLLRNHADDLTQRTQKTQSYLRSLMREETNLNESLSKVEDQNAALDTNISQLDTAISINNGQISNKQKDCQQLQFHIASKQLEKRKIENEIREKVKQLSSEKEKWRSLCGQMEQARSSSTRLESLLQDTSNEINFIIAKNNEITEVNDQLRDDLTVCQRHLDNLARVNKSLQGEVSILHQTNLKAISKLKEPFANRQTYNSPTYPVCAEKWGTADCQTGDFQAWK